MMSFAFAVVALAALSGIAYGEGCYCTEQYEPVCASNGQTFSNRCMLGCHNFNKHDNLKVVEFDRCTGHQMLALLKPLQRFRCYRSCPHTPLPVCGSDGVTYGSSCALNCEKHSKYEKKDVVEVHRGPCSSQTVDHLVELKLSCFRLCPHIYLPVCGSDGVTYGSSCALNCVKKVHNDKKDVVEVHSGRCDSKPQALEQFVEQDQSKDACVCTAEFKPVCGSNLHTYANMCSFECEAKKNSALKVMYQGRCIIMP